MSLPSNWGFRHGPEYLGWPCILKLLFPVTTNMETLHHVQVIMSHLKLSKPPWVHMLLYLTVYLGNEYIYSLITRGRV
jgi:hypothetical protein